TRAAPLAFTRRRRGGVISGRPGRAPSGPRGNGARRTRLPGRFEPRGRRAVRPVTFHLGDLPVHSFGLLVVLGAALGFVLVRADLRRSGLDRRLVAPLVLGVLLAAGVG